MMTANGIVPGMTDSSTFTVGRFRCTLTIADRGVQAAWSPKFPNRLTKAELRQYRRGRDAFLARAFPARSIMVIEV